MKFIIILFLIIGSNGFSSSSSSNNMKYERPRSYNKFYYPNENLPKYKLIDQEFQSEIVTKIQFKWRYVYLFWNHPDIMFTIQNQRESLIIGFHKEAHRYDSTRVDSFSIQSSNIYHKTEDIYLKRSISVLKVLLVADIVAQKEYSYLDNNCRDSALQLIYLLND